MLRSLAGGDVVRRDLGRGAPGGAGAARVAPDPRRLRRLPRARRPRRGPLPTVAPDLPGFGATPAPPEPVGVGGRTPRRWPACSRRPDGPGGRGSSSSGHSLGGRIAVRLAAARPELVRRPRADRGAARAPGRAGRGGRRGLPGGPGPAPRPVWSSEARMERARQRYGSADYRAAQGVMRDVLVRLVNERYDDALAALRCPVELVWGDDDTDVPVESARALAAAIPQAHADAVPRGRSPRCPLTAPGRAAGRGRTSAWPAARDPAVARGRGRRAWWSIALAGPRWLRVAQREHYLVDAVSRFALRWWTAGPGEPGRRSPSPWPGSCSRRVGRRPPSPPPAVVGAGPDRPVVAGTDRAAWRGRGGCAPWRWCGRASRPAAVVGGDRAPGRARWRPPRPRWRSRPWSTWPVPSPAPLERRLARSHVARAAARLRRVAPTVVAITGSFGKTSTKGYVAHLVGGHPVGGGQPGQLQQPGRAGPGRQRAPGRRHRGLRGRDGHLRPGRDRRAVLVDPPRRRRDHRHRSRAPGAVRLRGPHPRGQGRDPRGCAGRGARGRRRPPGGAGRDACARPGTPGVAGARRATRRGRVRDRATAARLSCSSDGAEIAARRAASTARPGNVAGRRGRGPGARGPRRRGRRDGCRRCPGPRTASSRRPAPAVSSCSTTPTTPTRPGPRRPGDARAPGRRRHAAGGGHAGDGRARVPSRPRRTPASPPRRPRWPPTSWSWGAPTAAPCCEGPGAPRPAPGRPRVVVVRTRPEATDVGARRTSGAATSCCTRTTCPTTTLERRRTASSWRRSIPPSSGARPLNVTTAKVAVVFGGPSPEHDVSILTGLQAARELAGPRRDVIGLYWTKTGDWFRVDAVARGRRLRRRRPARARSRCSSSPAADGAGFVAGAGRLGPHPTAAARRGGQLLSRRPGRGRHPAGRPRPRRRRLHRARRGRRPRLGMDKLAFAGVAQAAGLPVLPRVLLRRRRRAGRTRASGSRAPTS